MTPNEIRENVSKWMDGHGIPLGYVSLGIDLNAEGCCRAHWWPDGIGGKIPMMRVEADSWEELLPKFYTEIMARLYELESLCTRRMAIALIELSDGGNNEVTDRDLRLKGFTQAEIDDLGGAACEEAARLGAGPFSIVSTQKANAA